MRCCSRCSSIFRVAQGRIFAEQALTGLVSVLIDHRPGVLSSLSDLDDFFQFPLADLRTRQYQTTSLADLLRLLLLLSERVLGRDKVRHGVGVLVFARLLLLLALVLLLDILLPLALELSERLADRRDVLLGELLSRIVEAWSWLLFERNVGHVVCESQKESA